ncbi:uncharacterized protein LOC142613146 isoform X1 [Castanea sativa]|uniref:uncharacterized protein LOC142613146 isoform X1 n=1 Tax=Castanea sativa TaxID=21020 RepID=UPI003F653FB6
MHVCSLFLSRLTSLRLSLPITTHKLFFSISFLRQLQVWSSMIQSQSLLWDAQTSKTFLALEDQRPLNFNNQKTLASVGLDAERTKVLETTITSRSRPCPFDKCISQQESVKYDGRNNCHDKQKKSKVPFKKQENGEASGYENLILSPFHTDLQLARSIQGLKRNVRSLLGAAQHDTAKETVDAIENEGVDNSVSIVMDYAQPHRKPPIHNEKP